MHRLYYFSFSLLTYLVNDYHALLAFDRTPLVENRMIDQIYQTALKEGRTVTCWHSGDKTD